ncbi:MAG: hypothetical protein ABH843_02210, partial [Candidatus Omnitrophota bacterium]
MNKISKTRLISLTLAIMLVAGGNLPAFSQGPPKGANRAPETYSMPDILSKNKGENITAAEIELATDLDGDNLTYVYSGWLSSLPYTVSHVDKGIHNLHVEVSDGTNTVGKNITIIAGKRLVTELYVKEGVVSFLNAFSNISYFVKQGSASLADSKGAITEPKEASDEEKAAWESGFGSSEVSGGSGSSSTQKGEASVVERTPEDET